MQAKVYEFFLKNSCEILVVDDLKSANLAYWAASFAGFECYVLPDFRANYGDDLRSFNDELATLSVILTKFYNSSNKKKLLISPAKTISHKLPSKNHLKTKIINFGDKIDINLLKNEILCFGYEIVDIVQDIGEVSFRGEIIDICDISGKAFRVLLDIDLVESIREFELESQRSKKDELESFEIAPFLANLTAKDFKKLQDKISTHHSTDILANTQAFGFWHIDDFVDYLEFDCMAVDLDLRDLDDRFSKITQLPEPKIYKDLGVKFSKELLSLHAGKNIKILSSNEASFRALELDFSMFVESDLCINILSKDDLIVSLNQPLKNKRKIKSNIVLDELRPGELVVHRDYGVGKFIGLELVSVLGGKMEFVVIGYASDDRLLLPVQNLNMLDRYIASSGSAGILDKLGKGSFAKIKEKARERLFAIANNIVQTAAQRELVNGIKFQKPQSLSNFIASSGFEYTKDQKNAIFNIEKELVSGKVMDMLLSGDVGFGKTEVAMNAIFMCVKSGYQAMFFVPTTLLCSQHFATLKERFNKFDIEVFRLDRFTTSKEKSDLKRAFDEKRAFVVVGTHSLLSIKPTNLGLIVIDEEHKFGVKQKEKLKELSSVSHLLSMSATPIPRSLNMALSSIKSYATLTTAPLERLSVRTFLKEWNESLIKEAILREIRRGGQIFYVHNKISDLEFVKKDLLAILSNLKILILHSKIDPKTTEDEMVKFFNKEYDLLLCTSIVESGIHIPNVNTIIVDNANKFGIADLHQLRGRVGRSNRQGYCYFLVENKDELSDESIKRLIALENNSALGSGAVLAYHDLEIRGGGNLLGEAQSGHIEAIGYSLYLRMLEEAINLLLNKNTIEVKQVELKLSINAFLNSELITEDRLRLELYRRLSKCVEVSEVREIEIEIEERFGKLDIYTIQFLNLIVIKILSTNLGVKLISNYEQNISITLNDDSKVVLKSRSKDDDDILDEVMKFLRKKSV